MSEQYVECAPHLSSNGLRSVPQFSARGQQHILAFVEYFRSNGQDVLARVKHVFSRVLYRVEECVHSPEIVRLPALCLGAEQGVRGRAGRGGWVFIQHLGHSVASGGQDRGVRRVELLKRETLKYEPRG